MILFEKITTILAPQLGKKKIGFSFFSRLTSLIKNFIILQFLKRWYSKHERFLIPGALILGFIVDVITFRLINFSVALLLLLFYVLLAGLCIAFMNMFDAGFLHQGRLSWLRVFTPLVLQYSFGAVLSASVLFYSFSGSIFSSWPFILILIFLIIGNEVFKKYYINSVLQLGIYFFIIFSFLLLALPYITHVLGPAMFISIGVLSIGLFFIFLRLLWTRVPNIKKQRKKIFFATLSVFIAMNVFYFTNVIPPFPLSAREVGIFHSVEKTATGDYRLLTEKKTLLDFFYFYERYHVISAGEPAYVFSAVFSPSRLNTDIIHEWQYLDPKDNWLTLSRVSFPIVGGRHEGYRGYSKKNNVIPGKWRVNIKTRSGQTISRVYFKVVESNKNLDLEYKVI